MNPTRAKQVLKIGRDAARTATHFLRPGGELHELLVGGAMISQEGWERLAGSRLPTPPLEPFSASLVELSAPLVTLSSPASTAKPRRGGKRKTKRSP